MDSCIYGAGGGGRCRSINKAGLTADEVEVVRAITTW